LDNNSVYPVHAGAGGTAITTSVPSGMSSYITGSQYADSTLTHKYISNAGGTLYAQAWLLASNTEAAVSSGNGVYAVTGSSDATSTVTAGNGLALVGGYVINTNKAFVTYGPQ
jgi:hypothetical protein